MQEWHKTLSGYWSAYLNRPLTLCDVQTMMRLADIAACPPGPATVLDAESGQDAPRKFCDDAPVSYGPEFHAFARVEKVTEQAFRDAVIQGIGISEARISEGGSLTARHVPGSEFWSRKDSE